jgi:hypothetical protein
LHAADDGGQLVGVGHLHDQRLVGGVVGRGARVAVGGDHLRAQALEGQHQFAAQLTGPDQHHAHDAQG